MKTLKIVFMVAPIFFSFASCNSGSNSTSKNSNSTTIQINPSQMKQIGSVDERFQSYNVEMVEVVGGKFWKPYKLMDSLPSGKATSNYDVSQSNEQMYRKLAPINLTDKKLRNLAKGL
ncbi:MAG: hypothetical protein ACTHK0_05650, partial [Ginsengibacter sp.]